MSLIIQRSFGRRVLNRKRLMCFLAFANSFGLAAAVLPLLLILPVMLFAVLKGPKRRLHSMDWWSIAGLGCGLMFSGVLSYVHFHCA